MADRAYEHYSEAELLDLRRSLQHNQEMLGRDNPYAPNTSGYDEEMERIARVGAQIRTINQELELRRNERAAG